MPIPVRKAFIHILIAFAMLTLLIGGCKEEASDKSTQEPAQSPWPTAQPPQLPPTSSLIMDTDAFATPAPSPSPSASATPSEPPTLPPSFLMDFGGFTSSKDASSLPGSLGLQLASFGPSSGVPFSSNSAAFGDSGNWGFAAFNVGFWSVVAVVGLAVPVAAFVASFHNIPLQQPDGSWVWSYSVRVAGAVHSAELHGTYVADGVRWDMYISKEGEYADFLWYYGQSDLPGTEGFWILKDKPSNPTDLLRIDWHRNIADGTGDIKYTNIVPGGPENGGYIFHETTNGSPYNASFDIYNKGQDNHTYIEWNRTTEEGRVKDAKHFRDSDWHCWDGSHKDIVCP